MTGYETQVVAQRKESLADGGDQVLMVAAGKVGAPDRILKDDITNLRQLIG